MQKQEGETDYDLYDVTVFFLQPQSVTIFTLKLCLKPELLDVCLRGCAFCINCGFFFFFCSFSSLNRRSVRWKWVQYCFGTERDQRITKDAGGMEGVKILKTRIGSFFHKTAQLLLFSASIQLFLIVCEANGVKDWVIKIQYCTEYTALTPHMLSSLACRLWLFHVCVSLLSLAELLHRDSSSV